MEGSALRAKTSRSQRPAHVLKRLKTLRRAFVARGAHWSALAIMLLLGAALVPWLSVPLIHTYNAWELPVDLGWGPRTPFFSYGALSVLMAGICLVWTLRPRPRSPGALLAMGVLAALPSLLLLFQLLMADLRLAATLADQENQSLLIQQHLGYHLANQRLPMLPFQVASAGLGDRWALLVQLANLGVLLPLLGGLLCAYGAYRARGHARGILAQLAQEAAPSGTRWRIALWVAACLLGLILLGRAPAGLVYESLGRQALAAGQYQSALDLFSTAQMLNPALDSLPGFHQERGQALYRLGYQTSLDAGLYLAASYRAAGALDLAWLEDQALAQRYPRDALLQQDMAVTLEALTEANLSNRQIPVNEEAARQNPLPLTMTNMALGWLEQLLQREPENVYAHYLRGRIFFATRAYELAARDFAAILALPTDQDMQSAVYTYLAFCRAGVGDYINERILLQKAIELDHGYYNTTAREAASGLH